MSYHTGKWVIFRARYDKGCRKEAQGISGEIPDGSAGGNPKAAMPKLGITQDEAIS